MDRVIVYLETQIAKKRSKFPEVFHPKKNDEGDLFCPHFKQWNFVSGVDWPYLSRKLHSSQVKRNDYKCSLLRLFSEF